MHQGSESLLPDSRSSARALTLLNPRLRYHRATIQDVAHIPASGGALLVSNHGRLDFDSFILLRLILQSRGRLARLMTDHLWLRLPMAKRLFERAGAVDGTRENATRLLEDGEVVLTYPGGVREIFGSSFGREHLDWDGRYGFARVAIRTGAPVIPVAGIGVNNGLVFVSSGRMLGTLLFRGILRLGPRYSDYRNPLSIGILPIPLPMSVAVSMPLPCKLTYIVGEPLYPPRPQQGESVDDLALRFAREVASSMCELLEAGSAR